MTKPVCLFDLIEVLPDKIGQHDPSQLSQAISLKRIADSLEKIERHLAPQITCAERPVELVGEVRLDMAAINRMIAEAIEKKGGSDADQELHDQRSR